MAPVGAGYGAPYRRSFASLATPGLKQPEARLLGRLFEL